MIKSCDLDLHTPAEIVKQLCARLRTERLTREMTQAEVAGRAGLSSNTVSNLEAGRNVGFENIVRVAMVLGRNRELEDLFRPRVDSLEDVRRYEDSSLRRRIRKKTSHA